MDAPEARSTARPNTAGSGLVVAFGAVFALAGGAVLIRVLAGEASDAEGKLAGSIVGTVFLLVGLGIIWLGVYSRRATREEAELRARHPQSPWMWKPEWAAGEIEGGAQVAVIFFWAFAAFWNALSWPVIPSALKQLERGDTKAAVAFLFPAIGLGLIAAAIRASLAARRFGTSRFKLETLPGVIGGELAGSILVPKTLPSFETMKIRLVCIRRVKTGSGKNSSTHEHILYEEKQEISESRVHPAAVGCRIPVSFLVPFGHPSSSDENPRNRILWRVEASCELPGVDYETQFEIPVFQTAESSPEIREPRPSRAQLDRAMAGEGVLANSNVDVSRMPEGGLELYFPMARNPRMAVFMTLFTAGWGGVLGFLFQLEETPWFILGVFGLMELGLCIGTLHLLFGATRVRADSSMLTVRSGLFGIGRTKVLAAEDIRRIGCDVGMRSGSKAFYRIRVEAMDRKTLVAGTRVPEKSEAQALVGLLERELRLER